LTRYYASTYISVVASKWAGSDDATEEVVADVP